MSNSADNASEQLTTHQKSQTHSNSFHHFIYLLNTKSYDNNCLCAFLYMLDTTIIIMIFLNLLPLSKHFHIITIIPQLFAEGLAFVNRVGAMAEEQGHHPDLYLAWGEVRIEIWTHKINGLTESDFVFAAKADALLGG